MSKRNCLTLDQKLQIRSFADANKSKTRSELLKWVEDTFKIPIGLTTLQRILTAPKEKYFSANSNQKKKRKVNNPEFEEELMKFVKDAEENVPLTDAVILEKARRLSKEHDNFLTFSNGWLDKFKQRNGIRSCVLHGEEASVNKFEFEQEKRNLQELVSKYDPKDVFNMDECALFYRLEPGATLATKKLKGKTKSKDRITVALCVNMDGSEKIEPLIIGKSAKPRCFKKNPIEKYPVQYYSNKSAWMTESIFNHFLMKFNLSMSGRNVILLIDNASSHKVSRQYANINVRFLPPNMTSKIQPLDQGVIRSFKSRYRRQFVQWLVDKMDTGCDTIKLSLIECIAMCITSWISSKCDCNCWLKSDIVPVSDEVALKANTDYKRVNDFDLSDLAKLFVKMKVSTDPKTTTPFFTQ